MTSIKATKLTRLQRKPLGEAVDNSSRHPSDLSVSSSANHLCVLVHGLYGQPSHLAYIAKALRERYNEDQLLILNVKRNTGNLTYDGIELGGERVAHEIEDYVNHLAKDKGCRTSKLSIVGYSLGGLISRYAIGLLYARGYFDDGKIQPINFTTFASPHVGVRNPARRNHLWNVIGARTISTSGRQLFMIDSFRDTGRPLLTLLATRGSVFMLGLTKFRHRSLYANIVNDNAATFYTTGISKTNPFAARGERGINYIEGYEPVVVHNERYYHDDNGVIATAAAAATMSTSSEKPHRWCERVAIDVVDFIRRIPFYLFLLFCIPAGSIAYLFNAFFQTILSRKRIQLHEQRKVSTVFGHYDVPLIVKHMRNATGEMMNGMHESIDASQPAEYLSDGISEKQHEKQISVEDLSDAMASLSSSPPSSSPSSSSSSSTSFARKSNLVEGSDTRHVVSAPAKSRILALTPAQFEIIDNLNGLGFRKFPVYIHKHRHSHAAIIMRMPKPEFEEGKTVVQHWLDNEFHMD
ncbi:hypothetical protein KEM54_004800 [Ascosphaera aggregata]|nr:hypothetical protein KEM54_004800 [Ascosphaera aggregata]